MRIPVALALVVAAACGGDDSAGIPTLPPCTTPVAGENVMLREIARLGDAAVLATAPPGDPRLFVVERGGIIRIIESGVVRPTPFIDLSDVLIAGGEQGLLGLAFHPRYNTTGQFFVFYTTNNANVVARCQVSVADPNVADPTCTTILSVPDFAGNHNGGMIEFGSDGYLWIGTGDGGGGGDPQRTAQNTSNLLGKILRIDVSTKAAGKEYGIPADNPFVAGGGAPEVYILGLRNPWRWSFDRMTNDLWIGDVGQGRIEEMTVLRPAQQKGANLGWSIYEGMGCCDTQDDNCSQGGTQAPCDPANLIFPQDSRTHGDGWISIIAGQTYRGTCYPDLTGWHFYTDHASANAGLVKARLRSDNTLEIVDLPVTMPNGTASIHADARGELYLTTIDGGVYEIGVEP
ncbi:MAG: PQQ-dependent sugar dehydrogenase [Kofleriaceae bacterium]|nr:PQQ-dependent sugar dehydrogenase [Kofleriaceae bacterium]